MPEARDRLAPARDIPVVYSPRRRSLGNSGGGIEILADEPEEVTVARTPFRWGMTAMTGTRVQMGVAARGGGVWRAGGLGTPRNGRGRILYGSPATPIGRENVFPGSGRGRTRGRGSVLPSWYPRTPLRDITAVTRAIERRRARFGEDEGRSPLPQELAVLDPSASTSDAHLEHGVFSITPNPRIRGKPSPLLVTKVPKILLDITNQDSEESGFLTPQKKLLNSIDTVEKVVMEELRKLKRTPTAKKAEREKRVRTLMSMR